MEEKRRKYSISSDNSDTTDSHTTSTSRCSKIPNTKSPWSRQKEKKPSEVFRTDLITAMKIPDSFQLSPDEYYVLADPWRQEWEKGVQVPASAEAIPEPVVRIIPQLESSLSQVSPSSLPGSEISEATRTYLQGMSRYDLDELDACWLELVNMELKEMEKPELDEITLERVLEELETMCYENMNMAIETEEGLGIEYDEDVVCDVCRSPEGEDGNEMVFCDKCNVCVHQACYGILKVPIGSWLCRTCVTDPARLFQHNAWDNVEWSEEQEASARSKVEENSSQLLPQHKQEEYELNAKKYWDDFYKIHENGFFKDRHWLFTEFPELAPNRNSSQNGDSVHGFSNTEESNNEGLGSCGNVHCSLETRTESQLNLIKSPPGGHTEELTAREDSELNQSDGDYPGSAASYRILEVGCGAGNTVFPILQTNNDPGLFVYCCDFSTTAVDLVQNNAEYDTSRCFAFVHDLCNDQSPFPMPEESLDIVILIFVLSAILPEKMQCIVTRLSRLLKPGGMILLRDYGRYDLAQLRFKKGQCLSDNFYVRGDGTRVYFFTQDELDHLFTTAGLEKIQNLVDRRLQVNRGKQMTMYRVWIQCKYCKPIALQP